MKKQQIKQLIDRFFNGETTRSEEQQLYDFFRRPDVPDHLRPYASSFLSLAARQQPVPADITKPKPLLRRWAMAASIAVILCLGVAAAGVWLTVAEGSEPSENSEISEISDQAPKPDLFVFDNVEMEKVAATLGKHYKVKPVFENDEAKKLRVYLKVDKKKTIKEVVEQLNHLDEITVTVSDGKLIIK